MLKPCPECQLQVSDQAISCPHCGYPLKSMPKRHNRHIRLPNGFGQITEIKGRNLRNPYRAMVTVGKDEVGRPICKLLKPQAYFKTYNDAYAALVEYNKAPYELESEMTIAELYEKWTEQYFQKISQTSIRTIKSAWSYSTLVYDVRARDLRSRHIKLCMEQAPSQNIANRIKSMFNLMLDYALEYELVDKNYARDFTIEAAPTQTEHEAFSSEEIETLWKYQSMPYVCYILLQTYMGWRPQELCLLKRENINWDEMTITGGMKTEAGTNRVVPIHDGVVGLVKKIEQLSESLGCKV